MWETKLLSAVPESQVFTRQALYNLFKENNKDLSYNSVGWIIDEGLKSNLLFKVGSDSYSRKKETRNTYSPRYSEFSKELLSKMEERFPELEYTLFETLLLNEFVNHLYAQNILVLQVEKDLCPFTFDFLNELFPGKVLYNPSSDDIGRYQSDNCIILENRISEAPFDKEHPHFITMEKLLVDTVSDKAIKELIPTSEVSNIYENAKLIYKSDLTKIKRYAKRRNAWTKVEALLGQGN
ncbi:DUF6577 family protein [Pseudobutyrivibrio sp.]|uniref:DUF6577 family protein n=1 Tax=Pseudobutyrivibrio sp. TaxID=2014367 RepID=UPI00386F0BB3